LKNYNKILVKLREFTKKYYVKQLVKGGLLFLTFGLLLWFLIVSLEYTLWLSQNWRLALFLFFVLVEGILLYRFILIPLFYLVKVKKGLFDKAAALLIGKHFSGIDDKFLNLLELSENDQKSELLLASIEQKSVELNNFTFVNAIDFKENWRYARYLVIPLILIGIIWLTGNIASFFGSYTRVVNYDLVYQQPAPFSFRVLNDKLVVLDNEPLTIEVEIVGDLQPENVFMVVDGGELLLQRRGGFFAHTFQAPVAEVDFYLTANGWDSRMYSIKSVSTPSLVDFKMKLKYPRYTELVPEVVSGTGNATIPEGTLVTWEIEGLHIDEVKMSLRDTVDIFKKENNSFSKHKKIYNDLTYGISTSNAHVRDFEKLGYRLNVVKDASPKINVEQILDSINPNQSFFIGDASDDYKIKELRVVCYSVDDKQDVQRLVLETPNTNVYQFYYTFPSGLVLKEGKNYSLFFEVVDNDGIRGGKITKSNVFDTFVLSDKQLKEKELEFQNSVLDNLSNTLKKFKEQQERLSNINDNQKEEGKLKFEEKNEIKDFLRKQEHQEKLMQKFTKQFIESLKKDDVSDETKKMLQERLERQELEARKNERLLKELKELSDKIDGQELKKRLEEMGKDQRNRTRNLEQILELTKRYYVTEKMSQLAGQLNKLSERQEVLSKMELGEQLDNKLQKGLNDDFNELSKELDTLRQDNEDLKKPLDLDVSKKDEQSVKRHQEDALEEINKHRENKESFEGEEIKNVGNRVSQKQKSAAQKMMEISNALQQCSSGRSSVAEDAEMLRQILDNLLMFSFKQESLFNGMENIDVEVSRFSKTIKDQKELRKLFEHVDDSLFALSLRRTELSEFVNEQITEVYYNIDKSLENIAENQVFRGASYQQYVINATNALAGFLADVLDNMQQSMKLGQGNGNDKGFQLPDIIKGQQSIQNKMNGQEPSGKDGEEKKGEDESGENGKGGSGNGVDEMGLNEIYEIYKEQQYLREQLEKQLSDMIEEEDRNLTKKLLRQMEDFQNDLLENGIIQRTQNKVNNIQHQLLKLENASFKQGKQKERESNTGVKNHTNSIITKPEALKKHKRDIEILNRQALPLRQNYREKVKSYFKNDRVPL